MADESKVQKPAESADDIFGPAPAPKETPREPKKEEPKPAEKPKKEESAKAKKEEPKDAEKEPEKPKEPAKEAKEPEKAAPAKEKRSESQSVSLNKLEQTFDPGNTIFREGQPGDKVYIIKSGYVEIFKHVPNKADIILSTIGPGMFFGEMALLDDNPRSAGARAKIKTVVFGMTKDAFISVIKERPEFAIKILQGLCARLRKADLDMIEAD